MRGIISILAVATMVAIVLLAPGVAVAQEEEDYASKFCKEHDDFGLNHNFCVRVYQEYRQSEDYEPSEDPSEDNSKSWLVKTDNYARMG